MAVLAFLLLLFAPIDESSIKNQNDEKALGGFEEMLKLVVVPVVLVFVASAFIYVLIEQSIMSWLPTFNSKVLHLPATLSIQMASILAVSTALGRFLAGVVLKKVKWLTVLIICVLLAGTLVLLALPLAQNLGTETIKCPFSCLRFSVDWFGDCPHLPSYQFRNFEFFTQPSARSNVWFNRHFLGFGWNNWFIDYRLYF